MPKPPYGCVLLCVCAVRAGAGGEAAFAQTRPSFEISLYNGLLTAHGARLPGDRRVCQPAWSTSILFCTGIAAWKERLNFSSLMMCVSPPSALIEQTKTGNSGKTRKGTCCLLTCAALGSEHALLHVGGSTVSHQKRKSILSAQPPSSQHPILLVKRRLLFPGCLLLSPAPCCGWGR